MYWAQWHCIGTWAAPILLLYPHSRPYRSSYPYCTSTPTIVRTPTLVHTFTVPLRYPYRTPTVPLQYHHHAVPLQYPHHTPTVHPKLWEHINCAAKEELSFTVPGTVLVLGQLISSGKQSNFTEGVTCPCYCRLSVRNILTGLCVGAGALYKDIRQITSQRISLHTNSQRFDHLCDENKCPGGCKAVII